MRRRLPLLGALALLGATAPASATPLSIPVKQYKLANGLRLVVSEDHSVPTVAVDVYYDVGSRDEPRGRTGFAHLFEHMMFEGSANVKKTEHFRYIMNNGGTMNGNTSSERTTYFEEMPANDLDLALWLEADRMRALKVTQEKLDNQRETVKEERRQRIDNQPYGKAMLRLDELAYANFAYAHSTIGSMDDLDAAPLSYVRWFYTTYYAPDDAVITVCGDVNADEVEKKVEYYFGSILPREIPPRQDFAEPPQKALHHEAMTDRLARVPLSMMAFHIPPWRSPDHYALELLGIILSDGDSSRLHEVLVDQTKIATDVSAGPENHRGPDLFEIETSLDLGRTPDEARAVILDELAKVTKDGVSAAELTKAKNRERAHFIGGLRTHLQRALRLGLYALYFGDAGLLNTDLDYYDSVTAADIQRVAARYLVEQNRTDLDVLPPSDRKQETAK